MYVLVRVAKLTRVDEREGFMSYVMCIVHHLHGCFTLNGTYKVAQFASDARESISASAVSGILNPASTPWLYNVRWSSARGLASRRRCGVSCSCVCLLAAKSAVLKISGASSAARGLIP